MDAQTRRWLIALFIGITLFVLGMATLSATTLTWINDAHGLFIHRLNSLSDLPSLC